MTKININKLVKLANLSIPKDRLEKLEKQLDSTLEHVGRLNNVDTTNVVGTTEVTDLTNCAREDEVRTSLSQEEALSNAKKTYNGFFVVPVILEEAVE